MDIIQTALENRGVQGDHLLDALDLVTAIQSVGGIVSNDGITELYHATSLENAKQIVKEQKLFGEEDGIFFSTHAKQQIVGYGMAVLKVLVPIERLELDDEFEDELHLRVPVKAYRKYPFDVQLLECTHKKIVLVYTAGVIANEKDLLVKCGDCQDELYRTSMKGKEVINLLPD